MRVNILDIQWHCIRLTIDTGRLIIVGFKYACYFSTGVYHALQTLRKCLLKEGHELVNNIYLSSFLRRLKIERLIFC